MGSTAPGVLARFHEEAEEHLTALTQGLIALETGVDTGGGLALELRRHLHSLKGLATVAGAAALARRAHELEGRFAAAAPPGTVPESGVIDQLLKAVDALRRDVLLHAATLAGRATAAAPPSATSPGPAAAAPMAGAGAGDWRALLPPANAAVLAEAQAERLLGAPRRGQKVWVLERQVMQTAELDAGMATALAACETIGEVLSVAASRPPAEALPTVHVLLGSSAAAHEVQGLAGTHGFGARVLDLPSDQPAERRAALRSVSPEAAPPPAPAAGQTGSAADAEAKRLRDLFIAENADTLDELTKLILALEERPADRTIINELFRRAHNFKGSGGTFGLPAITVLGHHVEAVLELLRGGRATLTPALADMLLRSVDGFRQIFDAARAGRHVDPNDLPVLVDLMGALDGTQAPANASPTPVAPAPGAVPGVGAAPGRPGALVAAGEGTESIRVARRKIDGLVNLVSELTLASRTREAAAKAVDARAEQAKEALKAFQRMRAELSYDPELADVRKLGRLDRVDEATQRLGQTLDELALALEGLGGFFGSTTSHATATVAALTREVTGISMVPISLLFDTAPRLVRDLCRATGKEATLALSGAQTEIDKRVLERMSDPLMHLLRNAVDHGLEAPEARVAVRKPRSGTIELTAEHRGDEVLITMRDDGGGIDVDRLKAKAVNSGLLTAERARQLSDGEAQQLIFLPGISTKSDVSDISGRGVGMDVVRSNIESMKGSIETRSQRYVGTTFTIRLPLSLAIMQSVMVECARQRYCLQADAVAELLRVPRAEVDTVDGRAAIRRQKQTLPIVRLADLLNAPDDPSRGAGEHLTVAVMRSGFSLVGVVVDRAIDEQSVIVKRPGTLLPRVPCVAGATILADGRVAVVLDAPSLVAAALAGATPWGAAGVDQPAKSMHILVADDSATTRELFRSLLEAAGYQVACVGDGRAALAKLRERAFDLIVSDIQMPQMNGYELVAAVKSDPALRAIPVVLVTALASDEEKLKGLEAGADAYVVKGAFEQAGLLGRIRELTGVAA